MIDISNAQKIDGWMFNDELIWIASKAREMEKIVEVGAFLGRTTRVMADNSLATIYAIDLWDENLYKEASAVCMRSFLNAYKLFCINLRDYIRDQVIPMQTTLPNWLKYGAHQIDMVFIDGDHSYKSVKEDILASKQLVKKGLICGHDYDNEHSDVKRAVDEEFPNHGNFMSLWYQEI